MAFYNPNRSSNWNYGGSNWKLSRSKIDLFRQCPRCFYIDNKLGTKRPSMPSFEINKAVDNQLKQEFDSYRIKDQQHPLQQEYGIDAKPVPHNLLDTWRENFEGVQYFHPETGLMISGAIDDLWINSKGEYIVVDYKATAKTSPVTKLDSEWHEAYRKQIEVYQWLLRRNNLKVSDTGYFVYCTGRFDQKSFDKIIEFDVVLIPYVGNDSWVEGTLFQIKDCLESSTIPQAGRDCEYCMWWNARAKYEQTQIEVKTISSTKIVAKPKIRKTVPKKADNATLF
jgi:hypothetical protein